VVDGAAVASSLSLSFEEDIHREIVVVVVAGETRNLGLATTASVDAMEKLERASLVVCFVVARRVLLREETTLHGIPREIDSSNMMMCNSVWQ